MGYPEAIKVLAAHMADPATKLSPSEKREVKRIDECLYVGSVSGYTPLKDMTGLLKAYSRVERHAKTDRAHVVAAFNKLYPGRPAGLLDILADVAACVCGFGEGKEGLLTYDFNETSEFATYYNDMRFVYQLPEQAVPSAVPAAGVLAQILEALSAIDKRLGSLESRMLAQPVSVSASSDNVVSNIEEVQQRTGVIIKSPAATPSNIEPKECSDLDTKTYDELLDMAAELEGPTAYLVLSFLHSASGGTMSHEISSGLGTNVEVRTISTTLTKLVRSGYVERSGGTATAGYRYTITPKGTSKFSILRRLYELPKNDGRKLFELTPLLAAQLCIQLTSRLKNSVFVRRLLPILMAADFNQGRVSLASVVDLFGSTISSSTGTALIGASQRRGTLIRVGNNPKSMSYRLSQSGIYQLNILREILRVYTGHPVASIKDWLVGDLSAVAPTTMVSSVVRTSAQNKNYIAVLEQLQNTTAALSATQISKRISVVNNKKSKSRELKSVYTALSGLRREGAVQSGGRVLGETRKAYNMAYKITDIGIKVIGLLRTGLTLKIALGQIKNKEK